MSLLYYRWAVTFRQQIRDGWYTSITHVKDEAVTLWKQHSGMYDERCAVHVPTAIGRGHTATSYLIFQYLQYWYNQYFPVSAILVLPVFSRIFQYLQYSYFGNDQYLLVLQILENFGRYWDTSISKYLYQYCRYWKILVNTGITSVVYQYCNTSIVAGCFILSKLSFCKWLHFV